MFSTNLRSGLIFGSLVIMMIGCDSVTVTQPFGERPSDRDIDGVWHSDDMRGYSYMIKSTNDGERFIGVVHWDAKNQVFHTDTGKLDIRTHAGNDFLFVQTEPSESPWLIAVVDWDDDGRSCKVRPADPTHFRRLVENNVLDGQILTETQLGLQEQPSRHHSDVVEEIRLSVADQTLMEYLQPSNVKKLFLSKPAIRFNRVIGEPPLLKSKHNK